MAWPRPDLPINQQEISPNDLVNWMNEMVVIPAANRPGVVASNPASGALNDWGGFGHNIRSVSNPGGAAKGDAQCVTDGAMSSGSAVLTSASGKFAVGDIGKLICVILAGAAGVPLSTTIASFQSATQVTLAAANASGGAVSSAVVTWGTDDGPAIRAAITAAQAVNGDVLIPSVPVGYCYTGSLVISTAGAGISLVGAGVKEGWQSLVAGANALYIPTVAPYLAGSVLIPMSLNTDAIQLTGTSQTVNIKDLGIRFGPLYNSTGHGINNAPPADGGALDQGLTSPDWLNIKVYGHDGNHYAFVLTNFIYGNLRHLRVYGGGGMHLIHNSSRGNFGNTVFDHAFIMTVVGGSAHAFKMDATGAQGLNLNVLMRPQGFVASLAVAGGTNLQGTVAPTSAQSCFLNDDNCGRMDLIGADFESNVSSGNSIGTRDVRLWGGFGAQVQGISTNGGVASTAAEGGIALVGRDTAVGALLQMYAAPGQPLEFYTANAIAGGGIYFLRSQQSVTLNGGTNTIDLQSGQMVFAALSASTTIAFSHEYQGGELMVELTHDATGTAFTITWPANVKFAGGAFGTNKAGTNTANSKDTICFIRDGTNWVETRRSLALA